jgi:integrase
MSAMGNPTGKHRKKRRHHGEGTVVLRKDRWRARPWAAVVPYTDKSGRRREMWLSAESREAADALLRAEVARVRKGIVPTDQTVGQYVNAWLSTLEVGPGTWPTYRAHVTQRIAPTIGAVALDRLTPQAVRSATIAWKGAPATRAGTLRLLRAAMRQAVADRAIEHDPTAGIPYPKRTSKRPVTLTGAQARTLMALVKGERFAPIVVVALGLAIRRGEAIGLRTHDIDLVAGTVKIAKSLRYIAPELRAPKEDAYRLTATKTSDDTTLPLPGFVAAALRDRLAELEREQKAAKVYAYNDFVFCDLAGAPIPVMRLHRWWKATLKRAGLPEMRWHDLRGSCATVLIEAGVDIETIRRILRHKDIATTLRYIGQTPESLRGAADKLGEAMG